MAGYHFDPFDVGMIAAHMYHNLGPAAIARILVKPDGESKWSLNAVKRVIDRLRCEPSWRGERTEGSGAPRKTSNKQDKNVVEYVLAERGRQKVTTSRVKRRFPELREISNDTIEKRLGDAGLAKLPRRKKSKVGKFYLEARVKYCQIVKCMRQDYLDTWAYWDGTVYYLDRSAADHEQSEQAALGSYVWRRRDGKDALEQDCLGPSAYNKAQGIPVRVWGMLACGHLSIHILDEGETMNQEKCIEVIEDHFENWAGNCTHLICDFERCIRTPLVVAQLHKIGMHLVDYYPKCSQDFNAIENAWDLLKARLEETLPKALESRDDFTDRLRAAVKWTNRNEADRLWYLSTNQKERADDCLSSVPPGGRTKW